MDVLKTKLKIGLTQEIYKSGTKMELRKQNTTRNFHKEKNPKKWDLFLA